MTIRWLSFLTAPRPPAVSAPKTPAAPMATVDLDDRRIEVPIRRNARARRYTLRLTPRGDGAVVTMPPRGTLKEARAFVARHAGWLSEKLARPPAVEAASGPAPAPDNLPVRGVPHRLVGTGTARGVVRIGADGDGAPTLFVPGDPEHRTRRATDFLKAAARADLAAAVGRHAATLGVKPGAIRLKDTTSRWGSASSSGTLSFSWRLIMAPPFVLDYLAAHEVAHLREMNHSDRFWALCTRLAPRTEEARAWLKQYGRDLHRVGL